MPKLRRAKVRIMSQMAIYLSRIIEQDYMDLMDWQDGFF
jgi:hypothetical protein